MTSLARKLIEDNADVYRDIGTITAIAEGVLSVETPAGNFRARRAVSCLVEPCVGDQAYFVGRRDGDLYILSILARAGEEPVTVGTVDDLRLTSKRGRVVVAAQDGVDVVSGRDISMTSHDLRISAVEGSVLVDTLLYLGGRIASEVGKISLKAGFLDSVLDRLSQRVKRSYRIVEILDHLRAGQVEYVAENNMRLRGKNALVNADLLVKIDGDQIHLG